MLRERITVQDIGAHTVRLIKNKMNSSKPQVAKVNYFSIFLGLGVYYLDVGLMIALYIAGAYKIDIYHSILML
jgi:hypothetical protein